VNNVRFHPDGTCIASCSHDKKIKIFDIRSQRLIQHYDAHSESVSSVSFHPTGNYLLSSGFDATLKIWDLKMGQILYTLYGHEGPASAVSFSYEGDYFFSGGVDSVVIVWKSNVNMIAYEQEELFKEEGKMKSNRKFIETSSKKKAYNTTEDFRANEFEERQGPSPNVKVVAGENKQKGNTLKQSQKPQQATNTFEKLPEELSGTFEKIVHQLDLITRTMKIFEQRIATVEEQMGSFFQNNRSMTRGNENLNNIVDNEFVQKNYNEIQAVKRELANQNNFLQSNVNMKQTDFKMTQGSQNNENVVYNAKNETMKSQKSAEQCI